MVERKLEMQSDPMTNFRDNEMSWQLCLDDLLFVLEPDPSGVQYHVQGNCSENQGFFFKL